MPVYYDFEVHLSSCQPRMWRRFLLFPAATFQHLHEAIQDACGWTDSHLFEFTGSKRSPRNSIAASEYLEDSDAPPARKVTLASYFKTHRQCGYLYDFGDSWDHVVVLKGKVDLPENFRRRLIGGERNFPPDDSGGLCGYERCCVAATISEEQLDSLDDEDREDIECLREWLGCWDPEAFDLQAAKKRFDK